MHQLLRSRYQDRSITAIFQPHLYSRTRDFANEFTEVLGLFDNVWILPIYPAREVPIQGVSSELLLNGDSSLELISKEEVLSRISVKAPEVLVTLGAGDIANLSKSIQKLLEQ
jgi:UDP-N-acetylmuramate--alanine ligase